MSPACASTCFGEITLRILLVEDNAGDVILIRESLAGQGIGEDIHVLRDGEEAILYLHRIDQDVSLEVPSIILLDLNLPKRTGIEVLQVLRASNRCRAVPVMVVSSSDHAADRRAVAQLGATDYFRKPSDLDEFLELGAAVYRLWQAHARSAGSAA